MCGKYVIWRYILTLYFFKKSNYRYLQYSIDPTKIRKQDATNVIVYISENDIGRGLTWDFVRENWERLMRE